MIEAGEIYLFRGEGKGKFKARETIRDKSGKQAGAAKTRPGDFGRVVRELAGHGRLGWSFLRK